MRLSVIVPLAPAEDDWQGLMAQLAPCLGPDCELVLVASDNFVAPLQQPFVRWLSTTPGRAGQLNTGAAQARGRWLWFIHADCRLCRETWPALQHFIARDDPRIGWFSLRFRPGGPPAMQLNAWGANLRSLWLGMPFGDQGLVVPSALFAQLGGFDVTAPYGEDHLFIWTARRAGCAVAPTGAPLLTSARKYARHGWARTTWHHLRLTAAQAWPQWRALRRERP